MLWTGFPVREAVFIHTLLWIVWATVVKRNDESFIIGLEMYFSVYGLPNVGVVILILGKAFSFGKGRQKSELAGFIKGSREIERCLQRYQYFIERHDALKRVSSVYALNERQESLLAKATEELESLPGQVYELVQSLENLRNETHGNIWLRHYLRTCDLRHWWDDRNECQGRLGCCAASCGCCDRPRRSRSRNGLAICPGKPFMRMARETHGDLAHCSIDCGCCIRRRGFRAIGEGEEPFAKEEGIARLG
jgi:hypothetical protein